MMSWTRDQVAALFDYPFLGLVAWAHEVHLRFHPANEIQLATLLSIKTGGCPEDCGYCSQSAHHDTGLQATKLMGVDKVVAAARAAREAGAGRFCMGAAWRSPKERDMPALVDMVRQVKALGLETCMTLGMLDDRQAGQLAEAGLDFYNHNIDTSPEKYGDIVSTRSFQDRLDTLEKVRAAGIKVCCGGILGLGESRADRVSFLHTLSTMPEPPESVPLNALVRVPGTKLGGGRVEPIDDIEFIRTVAIARLAMPRAVLRLSAGREHMPESTQALCFFVGANSIFTGDRLLTAGNAGADADAALFRKLGIRAATDEGTARHVKGQTA